MGILTLYVGRGAKLAARGLAEGAVGSLAGVWIMRRLLPAFAGIGSFDPGTAVYVLGLIAAITGIAKSPYSPHPRGQSNGRAAPRMRSSAVS
jgi:hypothetical protein